MPEHNPSPEELAAWVEQVLVGSFPVRGKNADNIRAIAAALRSQAADVARLTEAIAEHHRQKADDRCIEDDDRLYTAAGLPPCDRRVGDKHAMHANCWRFITNRCEGGGPWKSYAELETTVARLEGELAAARAIIVRLHPFGCVCVYCEAGTFRPAPAPQEDPQ